MSESSRTTTDGSAGETLNVEDLFATDDTEIAIEDEDSAEGTTTPGTGTTTAAAEDTTAGELFAQLREDHDDAADDAADDDANAVAEESPEDIMARADEDTQHVDQIDDAIRADAGALDDLLLTGRREADGFLWVETENDAEGMASMFQSTDDEPAATEGPDGESDSDSSPDDDFSLASADGPSFEARAASFDDADADFQLATDAAETGETPAEATDATETAETTESTDTASNSSTDRTESSHPMDATGSKTTSKPTESGDGNADNGGLASRIRSILSG